MYKYEVEERIKKVQHEIQERKALIDTIINSNYSLPIGRPMDIDGPERYDEPDGDGYYIIDKTTGSAVRGRYMMTETERFKCTPTFMEKLNEELKKMEKELGSLNKKLIKINSKEEKQPRSMHNISVFKYSGVDIDMSRENLETLLKNIQANHNFIKANTQLVSQSNSFVGRIKKLFGNSRILGFGDIQQVSEKLRQAEESERAFIRDFLGGYSEEEIKEKCDKLNCTNYDLALNMFRYDKIDGAEKIKIVEDYGPYGDFSREMGEFELEQFDYKCLPIGIKLHKSGSTNSQVALEYKKAKQEDKNFMKKYELKEEIRNDTISKSRDVKKKIEDKGDDLERF